MKNKIMTLALASALTASASATTLVSQNFEGLTTAGFDQVLVPNWFSNTATNGTNEVEIQTEILFDVLSNDGTSYACLLYTSPSPRDRG